MKKKNIRTSCYDFFTLRPGLDCFDPDTDTPGLDLNLATGRTSDRKDSAAECQLLCR